MLKLGFEILPSALYIHIIEKSNFLNDFNYLHIGHHVEKKGTKVRISQKIGNKGIKQG